jgi:hypothetical protein
LARLLFFIHGMGSTQEGWCDPLVVQLNGFLQKYGLAEYSFGKDQGTVRVCEIGYNSVFTHFLDQQNKNLEGFLSFAKDNDVSLGWIEPWIAGLTADQAKFFWSHLVDVVLYYLFREVRVRVKLHVLQAMVTVLNQAMQGGERAHTTVVAHSLGTSVAHDVLAQLGDPLPDEMTPNPAFLQSRGFRIDSVFMLANVSKILESTPKVYDSIVRPPYGGRRSYCDYFGTFSHILDPFTAPHRYHLRDPGPEYVENNSLNYYLDFNIHDYAHYLAHPAVHLPIVRRALPGFAIGKDRIAKMIATYHAEPKNACALQVSEFVGWLRAAEEKYRQERELPRLIKLGTEFLTRVKGIDDACRPLVSGFAPLG